MPAWSEKQKHLSPAETARQECLRQELHRCAGQDERRQVLENSICSGQLEVYYQPKHHASTGALVGAEALVRWRHPSLGLLYPQTFFPLLEEYALLSRLDQFVWERVCRDLRKWMDDGVPVIPVSVNTARQDYLEEGVSRLWSEAAQTYNIPLELLHLEVPETIVGDIEDEMAEQLSQCRSSGIQVEIDDFGIGYSSLSRLNAFPVDIIKLDKTFLDSIFREKGMCILRSCISMAKMLNMKIVAEGVETAEQMDLLKQLECDIVQGFYYSQALPKTEFEGYLQRNLCKACC